MALETLGRHAIAQKIAYVAQTHAAPFPYLVRDVVALGLLPRTGWFGATRGATRAADAENVYDVMRRLKVSHLADRPYTEISGGERQLALIGRALAQGAEILVLDEPMTGLDYGAQLRLIAQLRNLAAEGRGIVMSTHHPEHAHWACDRVALLEQGRIGAEGPPDQALTPAAIERLYGVKVEALETKAGRKAFAPLTFRLGHLALTATHRGQGFPHISRKGVERRPSFDGLLGAVAPSQASQALTCEAWH